MYQSTEKLDYGLVIATYKREAILPRCLRIVAQQTVAPKEIIVVDASPYWEKTRHQIMQELAVKYPAIDWKYVQAKRASLPTQRNQGIDLATADILFLIDEDSLMYPDCAEEVMQIYAHDTEHKVVGIMGIEEHTPPDRPTKNNGVKQYSSSIMNKIQGIKLRLTRFIQRLLHTPFPPYDSSFPKHTLPQTLNGMAVHGVPNLLGFAMTFRRGIFEQIRFEETLEL